MCPSSISLKEHINRHTLGRFGAWTILAQPYLLLIFVDCARMRVLWAAVETGLADRVHGGGSSRDAGHRLPPHRQHARGHVVGKHEEGCLSRRRGGGG